MMGLGRWMRVGVLLCVFLVGAGLGEEVPVRVGGIWGTVVDGTPDCSVENCEKLAGCTSYEEAKQIMGEILGTRPAAGAVVTATNGTVTRKVVCDAEGRFRFTDLPPGPYSVSAMTAVSPADPNARPKVSATQGTECNRTVQLVLHEGLITVSGRVTDSEGRPIAGAKVTGTALPMREVGLPYRRVAVSDANGAYALKGFEPFNLYRVAGYLNGGSLDAPGAFHTQVEIEAEAKGFRQDQANTPKVPLITETQLVPARRLWQAMSRLAANTGDGRTWQEPKDRPLPASHGSTITAVDIVLRQ